MSQIAEVVVRPGVNLELDENDVLEAARRLTGIAHRTPVLTSASLDDLCGARLFFKCEHLQRTGSFKLRGAYYAVTRLPHEARGVAAHSSGNHAAAIALAARLCDIPAHLVMPRDVPRSRRAVVSAYGAAITYCEPTLQAREATLAEICALTGAAVVHPFETPAAVAGHGTAVLELLDEVEGLDMVLVPVGGGGLASGAVLASMAHDQGVRVLGVEPLVSPEAAKSLRLERMLPSADPDTLADGLRSSLGRLPFAILARSLSALLQAEENAILRAMRLLWERLKQVAEPAAAMPLAAILENKPRFKGLRVGIVLTGGNIDLDRLPWVG